MNENETGTCTGVIRLKCPAKINLGLKIVGRRSDGYHLLESLFWPLEWYDTVEILAPELPDQVRWESNALRKSSLPSTQNNLARRALDLVGKTASLSLLKSIPIGAGLGGGSSNAGSILRKFGANSQAAEQIGADVPFFLNPVPSWVQGIGEKRSPINVDSAILENLHIGIVIPDFNLSTAEVFSRFRQQNNFSVPSDFEWPKTVCDTTLLEYLSYTNNDLFSSAISIKPELDEILSTLKDFSPDFASMTGSGSTCVAVWLTKKPPTIKELTQPFRKINCRVSIVKSHVENDHD